MSDSTTGSRPAQPLKAAGPGDSAQYATRARVEIYCLRDEVGAVRYIGKANNASKRLQSHLRDSRRRDTPVYRWIRKCILRGFTPICDVIEKCNPEDWKQREVHWIEHFRSAGPLLNVADGGDEPYCSPQVRAENGRKAVVLRTSTPEKKILYELKRNMAQSLRLGWVSEETKAKLRIAVAKRPDVLGSLAKWL